MEVFRIRGDKRLSGEVTVSGGKNAALAIMAASLLAEDVCYIENVPYIQDVLIMADILRELGAKVSFRDTTLVINSTWVDSHVASFAMLGRIRASIYLMGALMSRFKRAEIAMPGGCQIGQRPIDQHIKGFESLGAKIELKHGILHAEADQLAGREIYLDVASVGATINIMLAAVKAEGKTTIVNCAKEPHIVDLANFLNSMGASVKGAGTDIIRVQGVKKLKGCTYSIIPDQIETGTWMIIAAATKGDITIRNCIPPHMEAVSNKLIEAGVHVEEGEDYLRVWADGRLKHVNIKTLIYPGFPTDLQQPMSVLLSTASGTSMVVETIFESRFNQLEEIRRMGAVVHIEDRVAVIEGVEKLQGTHIVASDLRGSAALVVAGLMAQGETIISNILYIDRGYENIIEKLTMLGADITRIEMADSAVREHTAALKEA